MDFSIMVAKIAAVAYFATGLGCLSGNITKKSLKELAKSHMATTFMGMITLLLGMIIVLHHNLWIKHWTVLITLIGWALLIEGVLYIAFPKQLLSFYNKFSTNPNVWALMSFALAALFGYFGFLA